jgi:hypothetical protein
MAADAPKAPRSARSRPWYLAGALIVASVFGLSGWFGGCATIEYYKETRMDASSIHPLQSEIIAFSDDEREAIKVGLDRFLDARDASKKRLFPIAIAGMLLGGAIFVVGFRAMAGRRAARNMLLQLIAAQAALGCISYVVSGDVRRAETSYRYAVVSAQPHTDASANDVRAPLARSLVELIHPLSLGLETLASLLIIVALTRPRSGEFFDSASDALHER